VQLSPRLIPAATDGGVCDQSRRRFVRGAQSSSSPVASVAHAGRTPIGVVPGGRPTGRRRTIVSRSELRRRCARFADSSRIGPGQHPYTEHQFEEEFEPRNLLVRLVITYQRAADGRPSPCRFTPTCSSFAVEALETHGTWRGLALTLRRLLRCHPFGPSGWDPVPEPLTRKHAVTS
jgi:uncharacterized protein